jgi:type IV secretion system protein VirB1
MIDLSSLIHQCAPTVAPATLQAIIRTESDFNPLALHVNGPVRLRSAPKTAAEAATWSAWLIRQGYSVDMGLMQINSRNLASLNLTPARVFDPCQNIRAGAAILTEQYTRAAQIYGTGTKALLHAISAYNSGTFEGGLRNGYVAKVVMHASNARSVQTLDLTCLLACSPHSINIKPAPSVRAYTADTAIRGFGVTR